ncbi:serine/threonine protein kinase [Actinomadura hallensis]|uniref:non-specific serine/threonine protein kinase n=1 Tax=Actinomadura hallensis TaxID=337895 RepID=A0A543IAR7_9ACTN|nr:serine/threonine protein kinase [Actinomadura hallensis]
MNRNDTPTRLPGFIELAELGSGAQGEVVLARHESGGGPVAIKYLASELLGDTRARETFRAEAQMLKRVSSPHVARLLDYLESPWGAAIILEAVAGRSLRKVLDEHDGPLAPEAALVTLKGSLLGLAAAHAVGVVHRDYKPANVLVLDNGQSKLIDFGVSVLTGQGGHAGTPAYMAPEQWTGEPATPATDLYAATCVFIECISGEKPFRGTTLEILKAEHTSAPTPLDLVPESLRPLVERGMAKNPADRIWDAHQFVNELEAIATQTYGADWERRGLLALGAIAATIATTIPLAALGGALLTPGVTTTTAGTAGSSAAAYTQGPVTADFAAKAGTSTSKGFLAKIGGTKGAVGGGAVGAGGALIAAWLLWPGPDVGGESQGAIHAHFTKPGVLLQQEHMPVAESPYVDLKFSVTPARAKAGTELRLLEEARTRTVNAAYYSPTGERECFGEKAKPPKTHTYGWGIGLRSKQLGLGDNGPLAFYRIPPTKRNELPKKTGDAIILPANSEILKEDSWFSSAECTTTNRWTIAVDLVLPDKEVLPPGQYLVTPYVPVTISRTRRDDGPISPEAVGATIEGRLPMIEVLDD